MTIRIGVVGYSAQKFDENTAKEFLRKIFGLIDEWYPHERIKVVSGLMDMGIPAIAYREAVRRCWLTEGIACSKAIEYPYFSCDSMKIFGDEWGDESEEFLNSIDILIRVGGGKQSLQEATLAKKMKDIAVIELDMESSKQEIPKNE